MCAGVVWGSSVVVFIVGAMSLLDLAHFADAFNQLPASPVALSQASLEETRLKGFVAHDIGHRLNAIII